LSVTHSYYLVLQLFNLCPPNLKIFLIEVQTKENYVPCWYTVLFKHKWITPPCPVRSPIRSFETSETRYPITRRHIEENVLNHAVVYTSRQAKWYLITNIQRVILSSFTVSLGKLRFYKSALWTISKTWGAFFFYLSN